MPEGQDDGDLPDLWRHPGREAEVENVHQLLSRSWPKGFEDRREGGSIVWPCDAFGAHLEDSLVEFLLS